MNSFLTCSRFGVLPFGIWLLILAVSSIAQAQLHGTSLEQLRLEYEARRQRAIEPLNEAYIAALDRLQNRLTEEGDVDGALKVLERKSEVVAKFSSIQQQRGTVDGVLRTPETPPAKMSAQGGDAASDGEDAGKSEFDPIGTVWAWSAPGVEFTFENGGVGLAKYPQSETVDANLLWERKGPRKFMVTRPENPDFQVLFEVLADGNTAVYSSLGGSIFKRMVSRIPATE